MPRKPLAGMAGMQSVVATQAEIEPPIVVFLGVPLRISRGIPLDFLLGVPLGIPLGIPGIPLFRAGLLTASGTPGTARVHRGT